MGRYWTIVGRSQHTLRMKVHVRVSQSTELDRKCELSEMTSSRNKTTSQSSPSLPVFSVLSTRCFVQETFLVDLLVRVVVSNERSQPLAGFAGL